MIPTKHFHQTILQFVNILELINHNVFQPFLPFFSYFLILFKDIKRKNNQIIIIQPKTFFLLIKIAIKNNIVGFYSCSIFFLQLFQRHLNQIQIIQRFLCQLSHLNHISGFTERHIAQSQTAFFINDFQHSINICMVQHQKTLGILHRITVLL